MTDAELTLLIIAVNARVTRARRAGQLMLPWVRGE